MRALLRPPIEEGPRAPRFLWLDAEGDVVAVAAAERRGLDELGPKAYYLAQVSSAVSQISVPISVCVPTSWLIKALRTDRETARRCDAWLAAIQHSVRSGRLDEPLLNCTPALCSAVARTIARAFGEPFRTALSRMKAVFADTALAVRSSGYEDVASNLNAGGNRTLLWVRPRALPQALGYVGASLFTRKSILQRFAWWGRAPSSLPVGSVFPGGIDELRFGILVQKLITGHSGTRAPAAAKVPLLSAEVLTRIIRDIRAAASCIGGSAPLEMELALLGNTCDASIVALALRGRDWNRVTLECTTGVGTAVQGGSAPLARYECLLDGEGGIALACPSLGERVYVDGAHPFLTQLRPYPARRLPGPAVGNQSGRAAGHASGLRLPARVLIGGTWHPRGAVILAPTLDQAWQEYLDPSAAEEPPRLAFCAVLAGNRLSHPGLMCQGEGLVVLLVEPHTLATLRARTARSASQRWFWDARSEQVIVQTSEAADAPASSELPLHVERSADAGSEVLVQPFACAPVRAPVAVPARARPRTNRDRSARVRWLRWAELAGTVGDRAARRAAESAVATRSRLDRMVAAGDLSPGLAAQASSALEKPALERIASAAMQKPASLSIRAGFEIADLLDRAGLEGWDFIDAWLSAAGVDRFRSADSDSSASLPPRSRERVAKTRQLAEAGLIGCARLSVLDGAFAIHELCDRRLADDYRRIAASAGILEPALRARRLLRSSAWIDASLLERFDRAIGALPIGGTSKRDQAGILGLARDLDPMALTACVELAAAPARSHRSGSTRALLHVLARYAHRHAGFRELAVREPPTPRLLTQCCARLASAAHAVVRSARLHAALTGLLRNAYYEAVDAFDLCAKLCLARVMDGDAGSIPVYARHLSRWWRWLASLPHVREDRSCPAVGALVRRRLRSEARATHPGDPLRVLPIGWRELIQRPPARLNLHQLHNLLHQYSLSRLRAFSQAPALHFANQLVAIGNGFRPRSCWLDSVTPQALRIELFCIGVHSCFAELRPTGWSFWFTESSSWGAGRHARLLVLQALVEWYAAKDRRLRVSSYVHESTAACELYCTVDIAAAGDRFRSLARETFRHVTAFVDGLWEFSGTPISSVQPFLTALARDRDLEALVEAAVGYRECIQHRVPVWQQPRHCYRFFFSVLAEFYSTYVAVVRSAAQGYGALVTRMKHEIASTVAHRHSRRPSIFGLMLCMLYPCEVARELQRGTFPRSLGVSRIRLHLPGDGI